MLSSVTVSRYEPSTSMRTIHSSVVRFADADPLKSLRRRDASPDTRALVLSRNTQKFHGSSSGWAIIGRRPPPANPVPTPPRPPAPISMSPAIGVSMM